MAKIVRTLILAALLAPAPGCAGYIHWSGPGWLHPDDARGHTQADSTCDFGQGADDPGSCCYVSRRPASSEDR